MKYVMLLFILWVIASSQFVRAQGDAPPFVQGQAQTSKTLTSIIEVPAQLVTKTSSSKGLLELGNKNILQNPSFEHSTTANGWSSSAGSASTESTNVIDGKKALKITLAAQTLGVTQDSTLYASAFNGNVQGLATVRVYPTGVSDVKLCARQAGTTSTTLCSNAATAGQWNLLKVPFILSATSNGLAITSSSATGSVIIDDAFLGAVDLKVESNGRRLLGTISMTGCTSNYSTGSTTYAGLGTNTSCTYTTTGVVQAPTTQVAGFKLPSVPSGTLEIIARGAFGKNVTTTNSEVGFRIQDVTNSLNGQDNMIEFANGSGAAIAIPQVSGTIQYTSGKGATSFEIYGKTSVTTSSTLAAIFLVSGVVGSTSTPLYFEVWSTETSSTYSSTNADREENCSFASTSWTGFGTVSNIDMKCKRQGGDLIMNGRMTAASPSASNAQIPLPIWNGVQLTTAGASRVSVQHLGGRISRVESSVATDYTAIIQASQTFFNVGLHGYTSASNPLVPVPGNSILNAGNNIVLENVRIPIEGWENSNVIIGQFNGLESCADTNTCTDTLTVSVAGAASGSVATSEERIEWINGNCTRSGTNGRTTVCPVYTGIFSVTPVCIPNSEASSGRVQYLKSSSTPTSLVFDGQDSSEAGSGFAISFACFKGPSDYVAKTAKAVASDQNDRTVGMVKWSSHLVKYDGGGDTTNCAASPCTTTELTGDWVNGNVTRSTTGVYSLTTQAVWSPNTWVLCYASYMVNASPNNSNDGAPIASIKSDSTGVITFIPRAWNAGGSAFDSYGIIKCEGQLK